jgi:hypothetical protein
MARTGTKRCAAKRAFKTMTFPCGKCTRTCANTRAYKCPHTRGVLRKSLTHSRKETRVSGSFRKVVRRHLGSNAIHGAILHTLRGNVS